MTKRKPTTTESKKSFAKWLEKNVIADIDIDSDAVDRDLYRVKNSSPTKKKGDPSID